MVSEASGLLDRRRLCLLAQQMETRNGTKFHGKITRVNVYVIDSFFLFIILQPPWRRVKKYLKKKEPSTRYRADQIDVVVDTTRIRQQLGSEQVDAIVSGEERTSSPRSEIAVENGALVRDVPPGSTSSDEARPKFILTRTQITLKR